MSFKLQVTNSYKSPITNFRANRAATPHSPQTSVALLRPLDANKDRRKYQSPASTLHTGSASQTLSLPLPFFGQISPPGWLWRARLATPRLRQQSGSPVQSAAPSSH